MEGEAGKPLILRCSSILLAAGCGWGVPWALGRKEERTGDCQGQTQVNKGWGLTPGLPGPRLTTVCPILLLLSAPAPVPFQPTTVLLPPAGRPPCRSGLFWWVFSLVLNCW